MNIVSLKKNWKRSSFHTEITKNYYSLSKRIISILSINSIVFKNCEYFALIWNSIKWVMQPVLNQSIVVFWFTCSKKYEMSIHVFIVLSKQAYGNLRFGITFEKQIHDKSFVEILWFVRPNYTHFKSLVFVLHFNTIDWLEQHITSIIQIYGHFSRIWTKSSAWSSYGQLQWKSCP